METMTLDGRWARLVGLSGALEKRGEGGVGECPRAPVVEFLELTANGEKFADASARTGLVWMDIVHADSSNRLVKPVYVWARAEGRALWARRAEDLMRQSIDGKEVSKERLKSASWMLERTDEDYADRSRSSSFGHSAIGDAGCGLVINLIQGALPCANSVQKAQTIDITAKNDEKEIEMLKLV